LQNTVERGVVLTSGNRLTVEDLGLHGEPEAQGLPSDLKVAVQQFKAVLIERTLRDCGGNQTRASRKLGIQRTYLSKLIKELNIEAMEKGVNDVAKY